MSGSVLNFYLDYRLPLDIRDVQIMPDVDISYALGSGLVSLGPDGSVTGGLAEKWSVDATGRQITFTIRPNLRWSDGSQLTVDSILESFAETKQYFYRQIPGLFDAFAEIKILSPNEIQFELRPGQDVAKFLLKLSEPMHGIQQGRNGSQDTRITTGPYFVSKADESEVVLSVNKNWYRYSAPMFPMVHLRRPKNLVSARTLLDDSWPDMVSIPSFMSVDELKSLSGASNVWRRYVDRLILLAPMNSEKIALARTLIAYWKQHGAIDKVSDTIAFGKRAEQIYPKGTVLYSNNRITNSPVNLEQAISVVGSEKVSIAYAKNRLPQDVLQAFEHYICRTLPIGYELIPIDIKDLPSARRTGAHDFYLGGLGIDTTNLEGGLSYYFESNPPSIPSDSSAKGNFVQRLKDIRANATGSPIEHYKDLMFDVVNENYVLPIDLRPNFDPAAV